MRWISSSLTWYCLILPACRGFVQRAASLDGGRSSTEFVRRITTKSTPPPANEVRLTILHSHRIPMLALQWTLHRLERILANRGLGTRSEVASIIQHGRCKVDGKVIKSGAARFVVSTTIEVDGVPYPPVPLLAIFHKPVGVECTMREIEASKHKSLASSIANPMVLKVMHPVGRLDADSSGLLLFSSNGELTNRLLKPSFSVDREYNVTVEGNAELIT